MKSDRETLKKWIILKFYNTGREMENLKDNREALETYWIGYDTYEAYEKQSTDHYKGWSLTDKEREYLDTSERINKRNELDKLRLEEMRRKEQQNGDEG